MPSVLKPMLMWLRVGSNGVNAVAHSCYDYRMPGKKDDVSFAVTRLAVSYTHLVQEALHLSDAETMEITHFERGHGLISTNNNNIRVEFKASPLEKDLITTDRRELREIVERKRREQSTSAEQQI